MSRVNDLIKKLCPNGVVFKTIGDVCKVYTGGETPTDLIKEKVPRDDYIYPVYSNGIGSNALYGYAKTYRIKDDAVTFSSIGTLGHPEIRKGKFTPIIRLKVLVPINLKQLSIGYLKYALETAEFDNNKSSLPNLNANMLKNIVIPIPPIEIQKEIVKILDKFGELEAELEAELEVRENQYEFWRSKLFEIKDAKEVRLDELFNLKNGFTPSKSNSEFWKNGTIPWFRMEDIRENGRILNDSIQHVTVEATKGNIIPANSIIISTSATIGEHALITCKSLSNQRFTYLMLKDEYKNFVDMKYIFYHCFLLDKYCLGNLNKGNFASIDMNAFKKYIFKIPSLEKQKKIVSILDRFDDLTSNITIGLSAEIELRRKQYEYYRNKLLNFEDIQYE